MTITDFNTIISSTLLTVTRVTGVNATRYNTASRQYVLLDSQFPTTETEQQFLTIEILIALGLMEGVE